MKISGLSDIALALVVKELKCQCHEIFKYCFFHQKAAPGPIRGSLGQFLFFCRRYTEIFEKSWLSGVRYTSEQGLGGECFIEEWGLSRVSYSMEWQLGGVSYSADLVPKIVLLYFVLFEPFLNPLTLGKGQNCPSKV